MTETMEAYALFWKYVIILGSITFFCLMIYTAIVGVGDIKNLYQKLDEQEKNSSDDPSA